MIKYKIPIEIKEAICPCYEDERSNDVVVVQNNNDELKSLNITVLFPSNVSDLPPSVSTFLDEYAAMLKENNYLNIDRFVLKYNLASPFFFYALSILLRLAAQKLPL